MLEWIDFESIFHSIKGSMDDLLVADIPKKTYKMMRKHWTKIFVELCALDRGLKPAWLNDFLSVDIKEVAELLDWMYCIGHTKHKLHAIQISSDILVVKINVFEKQIENAAECLQNYNSVYSTPVFTFDGGTSLRENPTIINRCVEILKKVIADLKSFNEDSTSGECFCVEAGEFTPTLFGIALGYPVIYIQQTTEAPQTLDLNVTTFTFKFTVKHRDNVRIENHFVSYSFSYPSSLALSDVQKTFIDQWKSAIIGNCDDQGIGYDLELSTKQNVHVIL